MTPAARSLHRAVTIALLLASPIAPVEAADWPSRTVRIITGAAPGSSSDVVARTLAASLSPQWKQPIVVENKTGADHILAAQAVLEARDAHTLLFTTHSTLTVNPLLHARLPYDPVHDFTPITLAVEDFLCIVASPSLGVTTVSELVKLAASKPNALSSFAVPGSPHLSWLAFQKHAGITTTFVPYRSLASALADLAENRIQAALVPLASALGPVRGGKIKLLAVTNASRTPAMPEAPTFVEAGYPAFAFDGLLGLFGPKDMTPDVRQKISVDAMAALAKPDVKQRLTNAGLLPRGTTPGEFAAILDEQRAKWSAIARAHGINPATK